MATPMMMTKLSPLSSDGGGRMSCLFVLDKDMAPCQVRTRGKQSEDLRLCFLAVRKCGPAYRPSSPGVGAEEAQARKRTANMLLMSVTLEVSKLSG
jgi:hypothetical protein